MSMYGSGSAPEPIVNRMRAAAADGAAYGAWCSIPSPLTAELLAGAGFDFLILDCQHGIDFSDLLPMLQAVSRSVTTPVVRVPGNDPYWIGRALDLGAQAIIVPMVSTRADAERAALACRHFPDGNRSWGPLRSRMFLGADIPHINREVLCLVMIETEEGIGNAREICSVPGIDGIFIGPGDLGITLGIAPGTTEGMERLDAAIETVRQACEEAGIIPGIARGADFVERGFRIVTVTGDLELIGAAAKSIPARPGA
jgi:4-hydroxy-2-oxoheptanedioate aldolase